MTYNLHFLGILWQFPCLQSDDQCKISSNWVSAGKIRGRAFCENLHAMHVLFSRISDCTSRPWEHWGWFSQTWEKIHVGHVIWLYMPGMWFHEHLTLHAGHVISWTFDFTCRASDFMSIWLYMPGMWFHEHLKLHAEHVILSAFDFTCRACENSTNNQIWHVHCVEHCICVTKKHILTER